MLGAAMPSCCCLAKEALKLQSVMTSNPKKTRTKKKDEGTKTLADEEEDIQLISCSTSVGVYALQSHGLRLESGH